MKQNWKKKILLILMSLGVIFTVLSGCGNNKEAESEKTAKTATTSQIYQPSAEEKDYLSNRFNELSSINPEVVGYIYSPGTELDEPIVQTGDNATYLDKTFEGGYEPFLGTVFMDMDNNKNFSDSLTWLFGHARGSKVADHRMFNDVNNYDNQDYFSQHPYIVIETPARKFYYEAAFLTIVPETTAFYRTHFDSAKDFEQQLKDVRKDASTNNPNVTLKSSDNYVVLSTCREEDETIRSNLYLRQIPDSEMASFVKEHGEALTYVPTR